MTLLDKLHDAFPGLPAGEKYGDDWPDHVAGHVEAGPYTDDGDVTTPHGVDTGFDGDSLAERKGKSGGQEVGSEAMNRRIDETVRESVEHAERRSVSTVGDGCVYGNETLPDTQPRRILIRNRNRKRVVLTNQGASLIAVGNTGDIAINGGIPTPNACYLPANATRILEHRQEVWVVGAAAGVVDWQEENY